jgi:hypothetical protein
MRRQRVAIVLGLSAHFLGWGNAARAAEPDPPAGPAAARRPDRLEEVLWWLPSDTQTIVVVRGPWRGEIPAFRREGGGGADIGRLDDILRSVISGLSVERRAGDPRLPPVAFALQGSRRFRSPKDLGLMPYEGANIVVFQQPLGPAAEALKRSWLPPDPPFFEGDPIPRKERIAGHEVLSYEHKLQSDVWTFYLTQPRPDVLITATDRRYLTVLLSRMSKKGERRALPDDLPEWKHLDAGKAIWAIRHYDRGDARDDPSSPLAGGRRAANSPDDRAVGLVFTLDAGKTDVASIKYLSANEDALAIARDAWTAVEEGLKPEVRRVVPGVVEVSLPVKAPVGRDSPTSYFLLFLLQALGHGVFL